MTETKMALMTRLRTEGRWEEADKFREETRVRLMGDPRQEWFGDGYRERFRRRIFLRS